jgi:hypothetical protein
MELNVFHNTRTSAVSTIGQIRSVAADAISTLKIAGIKDAKLWAEWRAISLPRHILQ